MYLNCLVTRESGRLDMTGSIGNKVVINSNIYVDICICGIYRTVLLWYLLDLIGGVQLHLIEKY